MVLRSVKRQRYPCRGRSFLPTSEGGAPQTGWVAGCRSPRPISQRCAESKHTDGPHSPVRAVRASTAHKSASAFASGFETMRVPTAADCRISRRQSAFMVGKSFTQLAALLFVEWRSKVRPSPSETSKRRPRAPRDRRRAPASVAFWRKDDKRRRGRTTFRRFRRDESGPEVVAPAASGYVSTFREDEVRGQCGNVGPWLGRRPWSVRLRCNCPAKATHELLLGDLGVSIRRTCGAARTNEARRGVRIAWKVLSLYDPPNVVDH